MQSDASVFGLGTKTLKLKPGASGASFDDYELDPNAQVDSTDTPAKNTPSFNGNDAGGTPDPTAVKTDPATGTSPTPVVTDTPIVPKVAGASATNYDTGGYAAPAVVTPRSGSAPPGWDQTKWADQTHQSPKYAVAGIVQDAITSGAKNMTPDILAKINAAYPGTSQVNGTTVNIPGIGEVQVINDGQVRWDEAGSFGPAAPTAATSPTASAATSAPDASVPVTAAPTATSPAVPSAPATPTLPGAPAANSASSQALLDLLSGKATADIGANIGSDPAVAAKARQAALGYQKLRSTAAEQAGNAGTSYSGGFDGYVRGLKEDEANTVSDFAGQRVSDAMQQRVNEITSALGLNLSYNQLDAQKQQAFASLAQNSDQFTKSLGLSYAQMTQQQKQFLATLDQHGTEFLQSLGLSYAQLDAQQKQAFAVLQENARQANNSLGFNYDSLDEQANRDATLAALGK